MFYCTACSQNVNYHLWIVETPGQEGEISNTDIDGILNLVNDNFEDHGIHINFCVTRFTNTSISDILNAGGENAPFDARDHIANSCSIPFNPEKMNFYLLSSCSHEGLGNFPGSIPIGFT